MTRRATDRIPDAWPLLLSREQACAYLGISVATFVKICPIPPVELGAAVVRYNRVQIDSWVASLPPKLRTAQNQTHDAGPAPLPLDAAELAAEERRSAALERIRARARGTRSRDKHQIHPARQKA